MRLLLVAVVSVALVVWAAIEFFGHLGYDN